MGKGALFTFMRTSDTGIQSIADRSDETESSASPLIVLIKRKENAVTIPADLSATVWRLSVLKSKRWTTVREADEAWLQN